MMQMAGCDKGVIKVYDRTLNHYAITFAEGLVSDIMHSVQMGTVCKCEVNSTELGAIMAGNDIDAFAQTLVDVALKQAIQYLHHHTTEQLKSVPMNYRASHKQCKHIFMDSYQCGIITAPDGMETQQEIDVISSPVVDEVLTQAILSLKVAEVDIQYKKSKCDMCDYTERTVDQNDSNSVIANIVNVNGVDMTSTCDLIVDSALKNAMASLRREYAKNSNCEQYMTSQPSNEVNSSVNQQVCDEDIDISSTCDFIVDAAIKNALDSLKRERDERENCKCEICVTSETFSTTVSKSKSSMIKATRGECEFSLAETFLVEVYARQARRDAEATLAARRWQNNRFTRKTRKERKMLKKWKKETPVEEPRPTFEEMGFWTDADLETKLDSSLTCPICMQLLLSPHSCLPCEHVFCEPCLRRLAKYNTDNRLRHVCPVCRAAIVHCVPNEVIAVQLKTSHAYEYEKRSRADGHTKYMSYPLPSKSLSVTKQAVASAAANRQRQRPLGVVNRVFSITLIRTCACVLGLMAFVTVLALCLRWNEGAHWSSEWWLQFCVRVWSYSDLSPALQVAVTNQAVLVLGVMGLVSALLYLLLSSAQR